MTPYDRAVPEARGGTVLVVDTGGAGLRLDKWLVEAGGLGSRRRAAEALLHRRVWVNDHEVTLQDAGHAVAEGDAIRIWIDRPGSAARQGPRRTSALDIVFEDDDVLVLNKPAGLLSVPLPGGRAGESIADRVREHWRSHRGRAPLPVHRLDRDTSGLVVFARTPRAQARLRDQFAGRTPERVYLAIVHGTPEPPAGEWRSWLRWDPVAHVQHLEAARGTGGHEARGRYRVAERFADGRVSALEVRLVTGKRHQIRAQAWEAGHPLVGERVYTGPPAPPPARVVPFGRQALHARVLGFSHPVTGEALRFEVPPPADLRDLMDELRGSSPAVDEATRRVAQARRPQGPRRRT